MEKKPFPKGKTTFFNYFVFFSSENAFFPSDRCVFPSEIAFVQSKNALRFLGTSSENGVFRGVM
jgi:hypothetical protein